VKHWLYPLNRRRGEAPAVGVRHCARSSTRGPSGDCYVSV
jgi:hypothetical protein